MSQNLQIDPVKKDYVFKNGSPLGSDRVLEASYYALLIPMGKYLYGSIGQGSLIYTMEGLKRNSSIDQNFAAYARDAINRQVVQTGKAKSVSITNIETTPTGTNNNISVVESENQLSNNLNFVSV